jgi:hypothetical protein
MPTPSPGNPISAPSAKHFGSNQFLLNPTRRGAPVPLNGIGKGCGCDLDEEDWEVPVEGVAAAPAPLPVSNKQSRAPRPQPGRFN